MRYDDPSWSEFDLHGVCAMRVAQDAPTATFLEEMFAPFRTSGLTFFDLTVTGPLPPLQDAAYAEDAYRFSAEGLDLHRQGTQVRVDGDGFAVGGSGELLTTVLPLIDRIAVQRKAAMVHAATIDYRGVGLCLPAWGGVGKTSTVAKLLKRPGVRFMGDDWAFLTSEGDLLGYAKPMFVKPHHRPIYPHLFEGARKPLAPSRLTGPLARFATAVHPLITRHPRLATATRHWSPEHRMVTPQQAFPGQELSSRAPLGLVMFVERSTGSQVTRTKQPRDYLVGRMVANFHVEMSRQSRELVEALGATGLVPLESGFGDKAAVLEAAIGSLPTHLLHVPRSLSADEASDAIVAEVEDLLRESGRLEAAGG